MLRNYAFATVILTVSSFAETVRMGGIGEAIVGSDQTQEHGEALAFMKSKADALSKLGSYVESNIRVERRERDGAYSELTNTTVRGFVGGIAKLVEGSRKTTKAFKDPEQKALSVRVEALFEIDLDEYRRTLDAFSARASLRESVQNSLREYAQAEREVLELSSLEVLNNDKVSDVLARYERASGEAGRSVAELSGHTVVKRMRSAVQDRTDNVVEYLENISKVGGVQALWSPNIQGEPVFEDIGDGWIRLKVRLKISANAERQKFLAENHKLYKEHLYGKDGLPHQSVVSRIPFWLDFPLALCLYDGDNNVVALSLFSDQHSSAARHSYISGKIYLYDFNMGGRPYHLFYERNSTLMQSVGSHYAQLGGGAFWQRYFDFGYHPNTYEFFYRKLSAELKRPMNVTYYGGPPWAWKDVAKNITLTAIFRESDIEKVASLRFQFVSPMLLNSTSWKQERIPHQFQQNAGIIGSHVYRVPEGMTPSEFLFDLKSEISRIIRGAMAPQSAN